MTVPPLAPWDFDHFQLRTRCCGVQEAVEAGSERHVLACGDPALKRSNSLPAKMANILPVASSPSRDLGGEQRGGRILAEAPRVAA